MGIIIDLIVIGFILLCVFFGYKKGLVKVGVRMLSFLIAICITFILYRPISNMIIEYTTIDETIQNVIVEKFSKQDLKEKSEKINTNKIEENDKTNENEASMSQTVDNIIEDTTNDVKNNFLTTVAKPISYNIIYTGVMIILFIIAKIVVFLILNIVI